MVAPQRFSFEKHSQDCLNKPPFQAYRQAFTVMRWSVLHEGQATTAWAMPAGMSTSNTAPQALQV
jgi:hypothetical protein